MDNKETEISVVMVPLPAQSHLNQLLHLAAAISSSDHRLPVHFLGSATHNRQAKLRSHGHGLINPNSKAKIQFHDLPTPPIATPDPDPNPPGRIPIHNAPAFTAYFNLRPLIGEFVQELAKNFKRIVIIYDRFIAEAVGDAVSIPNVESYAFNCLSGFNLFYILWETLGKPFDLHDRINETTFSVRDLMPDFVISFLVTKPDYFHDRAGDIHNTSRVIEGDYVDLLSRKEINNGVDKKQWAITPLILLRAKSKNIMINHDDQKLRGRDKCLEWLDKQSPRSVIYVSFGTLVSLSEEEVGEIAKGLEESKQKFIWVVREADIADIFAREGRRIEMPDGFEERVKENGIVVRDWAPQLQILAHKSTGGFMSHCGWNSCLESLTMGVPIAAWPMHSDQPLNAILLTQVLKTGLIVRQWAEGVVEAVKSSVIKNAVERLMAAEEGYQIRKRAEEISAAINESMEEGGQCSRELEAFITHITR